MKRLIGSRIKAIFLYFSLSSICRTHPNGIRNFALSVGTVLYDGSLVNSCTFRRQLTDWITECPFFGIKQTAVLTDGKNSWSFFRWNCGNINGAFWRKLMLKRNNTKVLAFDNSNINETALKGSVAPPFRSWSPNEQMKNIRYLHPWIRTATAGRQNWF